jgi:hypothetical protein
MAATCSLVASRTARPAPPPTPWSLPPAEPNAVRESVTPSVRAETLGVGASWAPGLSASHLFLAAAPGLVLPSVRGNPTEPDAFSAATSRAP